MRDDVFEDVLMESFLAALLLSTVDGDLDEVAGRFQALVAHDEDIDIPSPTYS